jgi:hypothetical protein
MAYNEVSKKATMKYIKEKMQQFTIRFTKSDYDERIKPGIEKSGLKPTTFIKQAIYEKIERDGLSIVEHPDNE